MIGPDKMERLSRSFVCVVGLGAVGSYATEALARSFVGRLRLVDCDEIRPTNFNRQLYALGSTLGQPKAQVAVQRVRDINPDCLTEALPLFAHEDTLDRILDGPPTLVLDTIDSVNPKVALLSACQQRGIPVLSCMGAALRRDPTKIRVGLLEHTHGCPLARQMRKRLRRRHVDLNIPCVYSQESVGNLPATAIAPEDPSEDSLKRGRPRRPLGSLPTLTGIFGLTLAHRALEILLDTGAFPCRETPSGI
jgi:tRNA A37 threonylcarbamoyladenosine dehydratase